MEAKFKTINKPNIGSYRTVRIARIVIVKDDSKSVSREPFFRIES